MYWIFFALGVLSTPLVWQQMGGWLLFSALFIIGMLRLGYFTSIGPGALSLSIYEHGVVVRMRAWPAPNIYRFREIIEVAPRDSENAAGLMFKEGDSVPLWCRSSSQEKQLIASIAKYMHRDNSSK